MSNVSDTSADEESGIDPADRKDVAGTVVDKYAKWSFGTGLIPVPAIDLVALTAVQLKMLAEIAEVYDQSFSENSVRSTLGALMGGAFPQTLSTAGLSSFLKSIPVLGTAAGIITMPAVSAGSTYAVGNTFIKHFESGGTFLNVDLKGMRKDVKEFAGRYRKDRDDDTESSPQS